MKGKCQYGCSDTEWKNVGAHEVNCKLNPKNMAKPKTETKADVEPDIQPHSISLVADITEIRDYHTDDVAWFGDDKGQHISVPIEFIGHVKGVFQSDTYSVLIRTSDGLFLPPSVINGFMGVMSIDTEFKQPEQPAPIPEPQPEPQPIEQETKEPANPIVPHVLAKKPGFWDKLTKKDETKPEDAKKTADNISNLIAEVKNTTG